MVLTELESSFDEIEQGLTKVKMGLETSEMALGEAEQRLDGLESSWDAYRAEIDPKIELLQRRNTLLTYGLAGTILLLIITAIFS